MFKTRLQDKLWHLGRFEVASEFFVGTIFVKDSMMRALLLISLPAPVVEVFSHLLTYNANTNVVEFYLKMIKKNPSTIIVLLVKTSP